MITKEKAYQIATLRNLMEVYYRFKTEGYVNYYEDKNWNNTIKRLQYLIELELKEL